MVRITMIGPMNAPIGPIVNIPPSRLNITTIECSLMREPISDERYSLSTVSPMKNSPSSARSSPFQNWPFAASQIAVGIPTNGGPAIGMKETMDVRMPKMMGDGMPSIQYTSVMIAPLMNEINTTP